VLKTVHCIVAEDTRHTQSLLQHFAITTPLMALHEHNERERAQSLITRLMQGESLALVSDAGTPLISDPGYYLVREARAAGVKVVPLPGACAAITALSVAGLPTDKFIFEGFLPAKAGARRERLERLRQEARTLIFYEAPHRILDLLQALRDVMGPARQVVLARELTKMFETIHADTLERLIPWVEADSNQQRGEFVVMVEGLPAASEDTAAEALRVLSLLLAELPLKQAVDLASKITGHKKNDVYDQALQLKKNDA
jgi:16S rRNA (cytidine1402-2'-O)-methyltransferase